MICAWLRTVLEWLRGTREPSEYERRAIEQIHDWKNPKRGWFGETMQQVGWPPPIDRLSSLVKNAGDAIGTGALFSVVNKALAGTMSVLGDAAGGTIRPEAIYAEYRKNGHDVLRRRGIFRLDLESVDGTVGRLDVKYKGLAFTQGAVAGAAGLPGLIADVPALVTLNLRAIAEYATYYGFDVSSQRERLFMLQVLSLASSPDAAAKQMVMAELARIARKKSWKTLEEVVVVRVMKQIARVVGVRLTKAKLAQAVVLLGPIVGGGFNAYYTARVCDAAWHLYRERFLAEKYGPEIIEVAAQPVDKNSFEVRYPEAFEDFPGET